MDEDYWKGLGEFGGEPFLYMVKYVCSRRLETWEISYSSEIRITSEDKKGIEIKHRNVGCRSDLRSSVRRLTLLIAISFVIDCVDYNLNLNPSIS